MEELAILAHCAVWFPLADIDAPVDERNGAVWFPSPKIHGSTAFLPHRPVAVHASAAPLLAFFTAAVLTDEFNQTVIGSLL